MRFPQVRPSAVRTIPVALPGRSQVEIRIGGVSVARSDPEFPAAFLTNEVLGGRAQLSRLFQRVRERGGLVYHASSALEAMRYGGYWTVGAGTGGEHWRKVVPMLSRELGSLHRRGITPTELREVRESAIGEIPLALESTSEAHELAVDVAYHRLAGDYLSKWPGILRAVRPSDVRAAMDRAMDPDHAITVLAGPLSAD